MSHAAPIKLAVTIGGFCGPHHQVRWQRGKLRYRADESQITVAPSASDWETFWTTLNLIGVWGWQASYDNPELLDGCQWSVDLSDGARSVRCTGSNAYPERWQQFLEAIGVLVGQPFGP